jgi:Glycosyltransferase family 28 C-terminal domain
VIGYYVHHHGLGHLRRATCIAQRLGTPVTALSSLPRPHGWPGDWITLPRDDSPSAGSADVTAGGRLHWAPPHHPGLRDRMARIAEWIAATRPVTFVVDVSAEVTALSRLLGVPTIVVAQRGDRRDPAHLLAYDMAEGLLAPWPATSPEPWWPARWLAKTCHTGAFSRFDTRPRPASSPTGSRVTLMLGAGGTELEPVRLREAERASPGWTWTALGGFAAWQEDPWPVLCASDVVVTHAGQNAIAECAAARRPVVVIPQRRPFGEQHATARALHNAGLAEVRDGWPEPGQWPAILKAAAERRRDRWRDWSPGDGASRAAGYIAEVTARYAAERSGACAQP